MNITLFTLGTRGDVQPYLALAVGLQRRGHHPTLVAPGGFCDWIAAYGVPAVPVRFDLREFMAQPDTQASLRLSPATSTPGPSRWSNWGLARLH